MLRWFARRNGLLKLGNVAFASACVARTERQTSSSSAVEGAGMLVGFLVAMVAGIHLNTGVAGALFAWAGLINSGCLWV